MTTPDDTTLMNILDYEFAGIMGNPAWDIATWVAYIPSSVLSTIGETTLVYSYYEGLLSTGVDAEDYTIEQLWDDYKIYGSGLMVGRYVQMLDPTNSILADIIDSWFTRHRLTPDMMVAPCYGADFDADI